MFSITLPKRKVLKKILVIRFSSIGDIILTTPVIRALKIQANCQLHILTKEKYRMLFATSPYVDKIHTFRDKLDKVIRDLRMEDFDFVVDLHKNLRSFRIKRALKVSSASFPKANPEKWLMVNLKIDRLPKEHIVGRYFQAVESLGVKNDGKGLDYFIPEKDFIDLDEYPLLKKKPFVAFAIGGQHYTKLLPVRKVVAVIDRLQQPVVLLGGKEDRETAEQIRELCSHDGIMNTCGLINLHQSSSLIRQSALVISNDTGLMHIAAAFRKPVISIWGNTIPEFGMSPYEPGEEQKVVIAQVKHLKCRPCSKIGFKKCPKGHFKCMMNQNEDFIVSEAKRLLSLQPK